MGEALFELEQIMRSSNYNITREEENVLSICKGKALKDFTLGACVASGIAWTALRKLGYAYKINLTCGAALLTGMWRFDRSLNSCVDNILSMEGSRMQNELANLILSKHRHDAMKMQLINKHFYSEQVFDDSSSDRPILRWRLRNFFADDVALSQRSHDTDTHDDNTDLKMKQLSEPGQFTTRPGVELSADPLACVFGYPARPEEIRLHDTTCTDTAPKRRTRNHKRSQRRHRTRHTEVSSDSSS